MSKFRDYLNPSEVHKLGANAAVSTAYTGVAQHISGGATFACLTAASAVRIKSGGNAADDAAGAGARAVTIEGLDSNFNLVSETIATAGASQSSATTQTFIRINRAYVSSCGTYGSANTAAISIETTGGALQEIIPAGAGISQNSLYTIPAGFYGLLLDAHVFPDPQKYTSVVMLQRRNADDVSAPYTAKLTVLEALGINQPFAWKPVKGIWLPPKTDLWCEGKVAASTGNVDVQYTITLHQAA